MSQHSTWRRVPIVRILVGCVSFLAGWIAHGQRVNDLVGRSSYVIQHWQTEEGLPQNSVTSIAQTPDGYLWLGTFNGLVRFDGVRFTVFDSSTTPELKSSRIVQTHVGRKGGLSILSEFQDFAAYSDGKFSSVAWATRPKANRCVKIIENSSGDTVVLDTERNIFRIRDFGIEWMASFTNLDLGRIVAMESDSSGKIWVALKKALGFVEAGNFIAWQTQLDPAVMLPEILGRSRSGIWFAGRHGGLSRVEGLAVKEAYAFPLAEVIPTVVCEDRQQQVWVGTLRDGLFLLRNGLWERISVEQGLSHDRAIQLTTVPPTCCGRESGNGLPPTIFL